MPEPVIVRSVDIVVDKVDYNSYGDMVFTDTEGNERKVGAKRLSYFKNEIIPDKAVRLNYIMSSFGKEYIYNAIPAEQLIKAKEPVVKSTEIPKEGKIIPNVGKYKADPAKTESIERQTSLKSAVELAVAKIIEVDSILSWATVFDMYLRGDFGESESEIIAKYIAKYGRKEVK